MNNFEFPAADVITALKMRFPGNTALQAINEHQVDYLDVYTGEVDGKDIVFFDFE